jgi:hypothetical protein
MVENAFGIMIQILRIFFRRICAKPETAHTIIKALCVLHNSLRDEWSVTEGEPERRSCSTYVTWVDITARKL